MDEEQIYVTYSEELRRAIAATDVSMVSLIADELKKQGIDAKVEQAPDPTSTEEDREVFLLILASAAAASLVGSAVARVIDAVTQQKRTQMVEEHLEVALDGKGRPILDKAGNPVYNKSTKPGPVPAASKERTSFIVPKFLKFDFSRS